MTDTASREREQREAPKPCPHVKGTVKWGIAASRRWCDICKVFVQLDIDWDGHP